MKVVMHELTLKVSGDLVFFENVNHDGIFECNRNYQDTNLFRIRHSKLSLKLFPSLLSAENHFGLIWWFDAGPA